MKYHDMDPLREQTFFDKSLALRIAIGLFLAATLFFFLHFREVRLEVLEIGSIAPDYVVAQVDFDFFDEEATIILKQQAVKDIGKIRKLSDKEIYERKEESEKYLSDNQEWRKASTRMTFDGMYKAIDRITDVLLSLKFVDQRTRQKMEEADLDTTFVVLFSPEEVSREEFLPHDIWSTVDSLAFSSKEEPDKVARRFLLDWFQSKPWGLEEDLSAERTVVRKIQENQREKYSFVRAGSRIIDKGERVTPRHSSMLKAMKEALGEKRNLGRLNKVVGSLLLASFLTLLFILFLRVGTPHVYASSSRFLLSVTIVILALCLAKAVEYALLNVRGEFEKVHYPVLVPFATILFCALLNRSLASFASAFLALVFTIGLAFESQGFLLVNVAAASGALLSTSALHRRKDVFIVLIKAWLVASFVIVSLHFYMGSSGLFKALPDILSAALLLLGFAMLVIGSLPLFESAFSVMTDVTLMEYMDPNNDLLRRLTIEAPGTYQHSVICGNLAEAAASSIGANGLFCRVATLYHDIGKMITPEYFTENQHGGVDIHRLLTPQESAEAIMSHVSVGVALARKAGLPEQFIDIIKEHHGTSLVYFFYRKQLDLLAGQGSVDEKLFRYSGPRPKSRESAIIMITDSFEAASRSEESMTEEALTRLVDQIVREKIEDGQLNSSSLTFKEIVLVKAALVKTLLAFGHTRIKYPKREEATNGGMRNDYS